MISIWAAIGGAVGIVLGLTGAGGAVLAVPLFIHLAGSSLKMATVQSLFAVLVSSLINWVAQRKQSDVLTAVLLSSFSLIGAFGALPLKAMAPQWVIQIFFISLCLLSVWSVWKKRKASPASSPQIPTEPKTIQNRIAAASGSGIFLGAATTLTGLGGGVILVPWLSGPMKLPMNRAVATSLLAIALTSTGSLVAQRAWTLPGFDSILILALAGGSTAAAFLTKKALSRLTPSSVDAIRKWVLTGVIAASVLAVLT